MYKKTLLTKKIALILALTLTTSAVAVSLIGKPAKKSADAAKNRPIASNNIKDGDEGYIKLTKTATTTSIKDVWKIELTVSGKNPPPTFIDATMLIDTSMSMNDQPNGALTHQVYNNKSRIFAVKKAAEIFVDTLWDPNYQYSKYRIGAQTMDYMYKTSPSSPTQNATTMDIFSGGNWYSSSPGRSGIPSSWPAADVAPETDSTSGAYDGAMDQYNQKAMNSTTTTTNGFGLAGAADKKALIHNLRILNGSGAQTSTAETLWDAGVNFYQDNAPLPEHVGGPDAPPAAKKLINELRAQGRAEDAAAIKIRRSLIVLTDGAPNVRLNGSITQNDGSGISEYVSGRGTVGMPEITTYFNGDPYSTYVDSTTNGGVLSTGGVKNYFDTFQTRPGETLAGIEEGAGSGGLSNVDFNDVWAGIDYNPIIETEAMIRKYQEQGFEVHVVGLNIVGPTNPQDDLNEATNEMFENLSNVPMPGKLDIKYKNITSTGSTRVEELTKIFKNIAADLRLPSMRANVYDQIGDEFDLYRWSGENFDAQVEYSFYQKENDHMLPQIVANDPEKSAYFFYDSSKKMFTWRIDHFAEYADPDTMTYYVKLKPGLNIEGKTYSTNSFAYIDYINVKNQNAIKFFPNPFVEMDGVNPTPNPDEEFAQSEANDLVGYKPALPSEGWKRPNSTTTKKEKEPVLTKEQAAAKAAGKTLEEIAAEKKAAKQANKNVETQTKEPNKKISNEQARAQEQEQSVLNTQKNVDDATKAFENAKKAFETAKKEALKTQKDKTKTPEQKQAAQETAKKATEKLQVAKTFLEKLEKELAEKKQKLSKTNSAANSAVKPTPTPTPLPEETPAVK